MATIGCLVDGCSCLQFYPLAGNITQCADRKCKHGESLHQNDSSVEDIAKGTESPRELSAMKKTGNGTLFDKIRGLQAKQRAPVHTLEDVRNHRKIAMERDSKNSVSKRFGGKEAGFPSGSAFSINTIHQKDSGESSTNIIEEEITLLVEPRGCDPYMVKGAKVFRGFDPFLSIDDWSQEALRHCMLFDHWDKYFGLDWVLAELHFARFGTVKQIGKGYSLPTCWQTPPSGTPMGYVLQKLPYKETGSKKRDITVSLACVVDIIQLEKVKEEKESLISSPKLPSAFTGSKKRSRAISINTDTEKEEEVSEYHTQNSNQELSTIKAKWVDPTQLIEGMELEVTTPRSKRIARSSYRSFKENIPSLDVSIPNQGSIQYAVTLDDLKEDLGGKTVEALKFAINKGIPSIKWILLNSEEIQIEDRIRRLDATIKRTIAQYEKLDFYSEYRSHITKRDQEEKQIDGSDSHALHSIRLRTYSIPYGYYSLAKGELVPALIQEYGKAITRRLKATGDYDSFDITQSRFIKSVLVPEVLTHMISLDLQIYYDDALKILRNKKIMCYGDFVELEYKHYLVRHLEIFFKV
ncbi:hypothetical protein BJ508DRAFT_307600 [Ascobolus immersus RN42]|uniref:Restriction of telomere capping protein 4 C-terminal domain-containing protein n=1 Tax=Ascobolus immersus RN42 TaxID=1160509 RepID=A0A3N4I7W8_ASCIM|nr:hypothetical protein BJ508DRAFT_307600 [Ascobolus immersus RN42]